MPQRVLASSTYLPSAAASSTSAAAARAVASAAARLAIAAAGSNAGTPLPLLASEPASASEPA